MNNQRSRIAATLTLTLSLLALYASLMGVLNENLYRDVFLAGVLPEPLIWGSMAQDIISIPLSVALALLSLAFFSRKGYKTLIAILGLAWYFFYAFGLYVMQGQYTDIYVVYLAIFGLSVYGMIFGLLSFEADEVRLYCLPNRLRKAIGIFLIAILMFLGPVWLLRMAPDIARHVPGSTYAVFIMDLTIVFPAFGIIAAQLLRKNPQGNTLAGIALFKGLTLCLAWAFAEWTNPVQGIPVNAGMAAISSTLTLICLILFIPYMIKLKKEAGCDG